MPEIMIDPLVARQDEAVLAFRVFRHAIEGGRYDWARRLYEPLMAKLGWCVHDVLPPSDWVVIHAFQAGRGDE